MRKIAAIGVAAALAIAAGLVLLVERLDTSFHTVEDLRVFTRVPVLATVPQLASSNERRRRTRAARLFAAKLLALMVFTFVGSALLSRPSALIGWVHQLNL